MSIFSDLCECICAQLRRQLDNVDGVLQSVNGQTVVNNQGAFNSAQIFGLPSPTVNGGSDSLSATGILMLTFVMLFIVMLLSIRRTHLPKESSPAASKMEERNRRNDDGHGGDDNQRGNQRRAT